MVRAAKAGEAKAGEYRAGTGTQVPPAADGERNTAERTTETKTTTEKQ